MADATGTIWGAWAAVAAAVFSFLGIASGIYKYSKRKIKLRDAFDVYYDPRFENRGSVTHEGWHSQHIILKFNVDVCLQYIAFSFRPCNEVSPVVEQVFDEGRIPSDLIISRKEADSTRLIYTETSIQRAHSIIRADIAYSAKHVYDGELRIQIAISEGKREKSIPFRVEEERQSCIVYGTLILLW